MLVIVDVVTQLTNDTDRIVVPLLILAMLVIAAGHLYVIGGFTDLYVGLPLWLWLQLGIIVVLFVLAWIATGIATPAGRE